MSLHFNNPLGNCGPIYLINVLNPEVHVATTSVTKELSFVNGRCEFLSDSIILDSFAMADLGEGVDYSLDYDYGKGSVIVTVKDKSTLTNSSTYKEVSLTKIDSKTIIGGVTESGIYSGISAIQLIYQRDFAVPNILAAPGWSHEPDVYAAMVAASQNINGRWSAFVHADVHTLNESVSSAILEKQSSGQSSKLSKVFWPPCRSATGEVYHGSTLGTWATQMTDYANDSIPGETCSNKAVPVVAQHFEYGNQGFDQIQANELNAAGITTFIPSGNKFVIWGGHTAAYTYGATSDAAEIFDTNIRMMMYILNSFHAEWHDKLDKPMTIQLRDQITNRENDKLLGYVSRGYLIGSPRCIFSPTGNTTSDIVNGDFMWDIDATVTPQFKSGTLTVSYTDEGLSSYIS